MYGWSGISGHFALSSFMQSPVIFWKMIIFKNIFYIFFNLSIELGISLSSKHFMISIFDPRGYVVVQSLFLLSLSLNLHEVILLFAIVQITCLIHLERVMFFAIAVLTVESKTPFHNQEILNFYLATYLLLLPLYISSLLFFYYVCVHNKNII